MCPGNHCVAFFSGKTNSFRNFFFNSGKIACHRTELFIELILNEKIMFFFYFSVSAAYFEMYFVYVVCIADSLSIALSMFGPVGKTSK